MSIQDLNNAAGAQNALTARINAFLNNIDADIATRQAAYAALSNNLVGVLAGQALVYQTVDNTLLEATGSRYPTIKEAIDATQIYAHVVVLLTKGQTHIWDSDISGGSRRIEFYMTGDDPNKPVIDFRASVVGGLNILHGLTGAGYSVVFSQVDILLPTVAPDPIVGWLPHRRSVCGSGRSGYVECGLSQVVCTGGVAGVSLGLASAYEGTHVRLSLFVATLDGPIFGVLQVAAGIVSIARTITTVQNGAALADGGMIGTQLLQN